MSAQKIDKMITEAGLPSFMNAKDLAVITGINIQNIFNWSEDPKKIEQLRYIILGVKYEIELKKQQRIQYDKDGKDGDSINGKATA
jgi:hypothetical protein